MKVLRPDEESEVKVTASVVKCFFEIIVILKPNTDPAKDTFLEGLQAQINKSKAAAQRVRILYLVSAAKRTKEQRQKFALSVSNSKYYTIIDCVYKKPALTSTFVDERLAAIKNVEKAIESLRLSGIYRNKNVYQPDKLNVSTAQPPNESK